MSVAPGCADYIVRFGPPDDWSLCDDLIINNLRGEFVTDDFSLAQVEVAGDCCEVCPDLVPMFHEMAIWRVGDGDEPVWYGPIPPDGIRSDNGNTRIEAVDRSFWWNSQRIENTREPAVGAPEDLFEELFKSMPPECHGRTELIRTTNASFVSEIDYETGEEVFRPVEVLASDALDWSTIRNETWIGAPNINPGLPPLDLSDATLLDGAGRGYSGDGFTSASILSTDDDQNSIETRAQTAVSVPWCLHVSESGRSIVMPSDRAQELVANPIPTRSLIVEGAALAQIPGFSLFDMIPGRLANVAGACADDELQEQILETVAFEWSRLVATGQQNERISIGTTAPAILLR